MSTPDTIPDPDWACLPGCTPRHPEGKFDAIRASVRPGMDAQALEQTPAWKTGLVWLERGFFWEVHEVLEPIWAALPPASAERASVQALIQLANAALKQKMGQARAAVRICDLAEGVLPTRGVRALPMGICRTRLCAALQEIRAGQIPDLSGVVQNNAHLPEE